MNKVGNLEQKLKMLQRQLSSCIGNFHDPLTFMTQVDSMIQSLRNFTFAIQANKSDIPEFDKWYEGWREKMKKDEYLTWLHNIRTDVVHKDVLTTESHAVLTLFPDHLIKIRTVEFDIMKPTQEIISEGVERANKNPELKHSTAIIDRYYIFRINDSPVDTIHVLLAAYDFMGRMYDDLISYVQDGKLLNPDMEPLKDFSYSSPDKLSIAFKLKDGSVISERVVRINRDDSKEAMAMAKKRYGKFDLKHNLKSKSYKEYTRAQFEIARKIFNKDGFHMTMIHYHSSKGWMIVSPMFTDRAEKIYFFKGFSEKVKEEKIDKMVFVTESWLYEDLEKGLKHINDGKEIKTLRNKKESLDAYYVDNKGNFFIMTAPISRASDKVRVGQPKEQNGVHKEMPILAPIFAAWDLIDESESES